MQFQEKRKYLEIFVNRLKSNSWSKISGFPFCHDDIAGCGGAAAGDTLNWVALQKFELYSERFIFGFDLKNEDIFFLWLGLIYRLNVLLQVWTGLGDVYHL